MNNKIFDFTILVTIIVEKTLYDVFFLIYILLKKDFKNINVFFLFDGVYILNNFFYDIYYNKYNNYLKKIFLDYNLYFFICISAALRRNLSNLKKEHNFKWSTLLQLQYFCINSKKILFFG